MSEIRLVVPMSPPSGRPFASRKGRPNCEVLPNGCWNYLGFTDRNGYGMGEDKSKWPNEQYAHRAAWVRVYGHIPDGMTIDHLCRNRTCINPNHLEVVTLKENVRRSPRTKLTEESVAEIRMSASKNTELARKFGVTRQAIYRVRKGLMWN